MCWRLNLRNIYADGTVGFKDRTMHYQFLSSILLSLVPYGLDDCDTAIEYAHNFQLRE